MNKDDSEPAGSDAGEDDEEHVLQSVTIQSKNRLPIPKDLRPVICEDVEELPVMYWNYERHQELAILSDERLQQPQYDRLVQPYKLLNGTRVTVPDKIQDISDSEFDKGDVVYLLGLEDMVKGDGPNSLYVLTERKMWDVILEEEELDPEVQNKDSIRETVLNTAPAFLPPPR